MTRLPLAAAYFVPGEEKERKLPMSSEQLQAPVLAKVAPWSGAAVCRPVYESLYPGVVRSGPDPVIPPPESRRGSCQNLRALAPPYYPPAFQCDVDPR